MFNTISFRHTNRTNNLANNDASEQYNFLIRITLQRIFLLQNRVWKSRVETFLRLVGVSHGEVMNDGTARVTCGN